MAKSQKLLGVITKGVTTMKQQLTALLQNEIAMYKATVQVLFRFGIVISVAYTIVHLF